MDPSLFIYLAAGVVIAGLLIWGGLEWYAALLLGLIAPFIGLILSIPITLLVSLVLPESVVAGESRAEVLSISSLAIGQAIVLGGSVLMALSMRRESKRPAEVQAMLDAAAKRANDGEANKT